MRMWTVVKVTSGADMLRVATLEPGQSLLVGRDPSAGLVLDDNGVSRRHCSLIHESGGVRLADLGSTHGTFLNGDRISSPRRVTFGDRIDIGAITLRIDRIDDVELHRLQGLAPKIDTARYDPETGLFTRKWLGDELDELVQRARARRSPICAVLFEVDELPLIEKRAGRTGVENALRTIARAVLYAIKPVDAGVRFAPNQMLAFVTAATQHQAFDVAEKVRQQVVAHPWTAVGIPGAPLSVSAGVADLAADEEVDSWLDRAEEGLLLAIRGGRNRTCLAPSAIGGGTKTIPDVR
jgi:diguanylate cyclase (GGDEF)-like protein